MSGNGFVSLKSLAGRAPSDAAGILAEIRRIYFATTRQTIENDLAHAIELLKSLPDEETREKATVYMEGLAQMRREWGSRKSKVRSQKSKARSSRFKGGK
jgi:hypothetical protein